MRRKVYEIREIGLAFSNKMLSTLHEGDERRIRALEANLPWHLRRRSYSLLDLEERARRKGRL